MHFSYRFSVWEGIKMMAFPHDGGLGRLRVVFVFSSEIVRKNNGLPKREAIALIIRSERQGLFSTLAVAFTFAVTFSFSIAFAFTVAFAFTLLFGYANKHVLELPSSISQIEGNVFIEVETPDGNELIKSILVPKGTIAKFQKLIPTKFHSLMRETCK